MYSLVPMTLFISTLVAAAVYGLWRHDRDKRQRETFEKALRQAGELRDLREREFERRVEQSRDGTPLLTLLPRKVRPQES